MTDTFDLLYDLAGQASFARLAEGIATGGSATTLIDTTAKGPKEFGSKADDYWIGGIVFDRVNKEYADITDSKKSTQTITHDAMDTGFSAGVKYAVARKTRDRSSLLGAINSIVTGFEILEVDATLVGVSGQHVYTLPADVRDLREVYVQDPDSDEPNPWPSWEIRKTATGSADEIYLHTIPPSGKAIELRHVIFHPELTAETSVLDKSIHKDHVIFNVVIDEMLATMRIDDDPFYQVAFNEYKDRRTRLEEKHPLPVMPQVQVNIPVLGGVSRSRRYPGDRQQR